MLCRDHGIQKNLWIILLRPRPLIPVNYKLAILLLLHSQTRGIKKKYPPALRGRLSLLVRIIAKYRNGLENRVVYDTFRRKS